MPRKPAPLRCIYEMKVVLDGVRPTVWRTFRIPAEASLLDLHYVLQVVMGWRNSHLHEFRQGRQRYSMPAPDGDDFNDHLIDVADVEICDLLTRPKQKLVYAYDFGDDWRHTVSLVAIHEDSGPEVQCLAGERACPPEDCGGPGGYERLLGILADPKHPEHTDMAEWFAEMTQPGHDVAVCPLEQINEELEDGLDAVREMFEADMDEDDGADAADWNIIPFPKR